jgi:hypothetical protein
VATPRPPAAAGAEVVEIVGGAATPPVSPYLGPAAAPPAPPPCAASIAVVKEQLAELHRWNDRRITS